MKQVCETLSIDIEKLRNREITPEQANAVARLIQVYLNTIKLELNAGKKIKEILAIDIEIKKTIEDKIPKKIRSRSI
jgi:hypothetical protein